MKNRLSCQQALLHKWMQVCDLCKVRKFMLDIQNHRTPRTYLGPCQTVYDKGFLLNDFVLQGTKYAFALSHIINLKIH